MRVLLRLQRRVKSLSQIAANALRQSFILELFPDIFAELPPGLPPNRGVGMSMNTGDSSPVSKPMYRLSPKEKAEVEQQLADLVDKGFVRPSHSAWGALSSLWRRSVESCECV